MKLCYERIYSKTALDVAALKTCAGPLTGQGRTALVPINRRESPATLTGKLGADVVALVETLPSLSLVEEVPDAPSPLADATSRLDGVVWLPLLVATTELVWREALAAIESKSSIYLGRKAAQRMLDGLLP